MRFFCSFIWFRFEDVSCLLSTVRRNKYGKCEDWTRAEKNNIFFMFFCGILLSSIVNAPSLYFFLSQFNALAHAAAQTHTKLYLSTLHFCRAASSSTDFVYIFRFSINIASQYWPNYLYESIYFYVFFFRRLFRLFFSTPPRVWLLLSLHLI